MTETTGAMRVHTPGGPDAMVWEQVPIAAPAPHQVRLRQTAVGVNFIDTYHRSGLYKLDLPFTPGSEGAGIVEAVGSEVRDFQPGDRVAYGDAPGAYCQERLVAADKLVRLPDGIDDEIAAAVMLKGLTAEYLLRRVFPVADGHLVLFHAAAGGVGSIACQWAAALGATVIGTVGSEEKAELARRNGCAHVINYRTEDFVARVREITDGRGVDVVYDSVGKDTFPGSLDCLKMRGWWVPFGQSSGVVPDFNPLLLMNKGSLYMTRPRLSHYVADRGEYDTAATALFHAIERGIIKVEIGATFPLVDAADAHRALESRATTGSTVLLP